MSFDKLGIAVHDFPCDTVAHSYKSNQPPSFCLFEAQALEWVIGLRIALGIEDAHTTLMHPLDDAKYWMKMTAKVYLTSPGRIESPIKVRVLLDPFAQDSHIFLGAPLPEDGPQFGSWLKVVLTSINNNVRTYKAVLR